MERAATPEETAKIAKLLGEAVDAGALRLLHRRSLNQHLGFEGKPLACRNASREELKAYANALKERGKGAIEIALTRQVGVLERGPVRAARLPADRERPAGDLHRPVRPRRHPRGGARHAAPRRADDRQGRAAADLAAAADARSRHEQPVLLRRLPGVEAGVRRHQQGGAEEGLRRSGLPQRSSATSSRTRRASATGGASASTRSRTRR